MDSVLNRKRQSADKTLESLIGQSQRSNKDLMTYLEKAGIRLTDEDWQVLTEGRSDYRLDNSRLMDGRPVQTRAFTTDGHHPPRHTDMSYRLDCTAAEYRSIDGRLGLLKDRDNSGILLHEDWSLVDTDADLSQKAEAIENQLDKLEAFESSHLDSRCYSQSLHRAAD